MQFCARSGLACVTGQWRVWLCRLHTSGYALSVWGAPGFPGFGLSALSLVFRSSRVPSRLTIRSSRRRVSASLKLPTARAILDLHCCGRRGLTLVLGGRKAFDCFAFQHGDFTGFGWLCSSVCFLRRCFFGQVRRTRSNLSRVTLAGFGNGDWRAQLSRN